MFFKSLVINIYYIIQHFKYNLLVYFDFLQKYYCYIVHVLC